MSQTLEAIATYIRERLPKGYATTFHMADPERITYDYILIEVDDPEPIVPGPIIFLKRPLILYEIAIQNNMLVINNWYGSMATRRVPVVSLDEPDSLQRTVHTLNRLLREDEERRRKGPTEEAAAQYIRDVTND